MPSNYNTRPNKHVDRELFVELIGQVFSRTDSDRCAYISMGGPQMSDHVSMYRRNGIKKLYSFDLDPAIVKRQAFNEPTDTTVCDAHHSNLLANRLDWIADILDADRLVVWLDYTGTSERARQLAEFQDLLQSLSPGDVARITLDASLPNAKLKASLTKLVKDDHWLAMETLFKRELGAYYPQDIELTSQNDVPPLLATCIERACIRAVAANGRTALQYKPILLTNYADSTPMLTATVLVQNAQSEPSPPQGFAFLSENWQSIERLEIPELTVRERSFADTRLQMTEDEIRASFGFQIAAGAQAIRQWGSFKRYHRFLPQFQHVDVK